MKDFDLDSLEKKVADELPADFFEQMQENVLRETVWKKRGKVINLNWFYGAAASLAVIFGVNYFLKTEKSITSAVVPQEIAANTTMDKAITAQPAQIAIPEPAKAKKSTEVNLTLPKITYQNHSYASTAQHSVSPQLSTQSKSKVKVEDILSEFSDEDLDMVTHNTEQDIYLDLYN